MSNNYKFEDLPDLLRGQNIIEAINFCQDFSVKRLSLIKSLDVDERQMALYYLPWVLEIFMKLAIVYCSETDKKNNAEIVFNICIKIIANQAYAFQESLRNDKCVFMENYIYYIERNQLENVFLMLFVTFTILITILNLERFS